MGSRRFHGSNPNLSPSVQVISLGFTAAMLGLNVLLLAACALPPPAIPVFSMGALTPEQAAASARFKAKAGTGECRSVEWDVVGVLLPIYPWIEVAPNRLEYDWTRPSVRMTLDDVVDLLGEPDSMSEARWGYSIQGCSNADCREGSYHAISIRDRKVRERFAITVL